jgi:hypothetical protein
MNHQTNNVSLADLKVCIHDIDQKIRELSTLVNLMENSTAATEKEEEGQNNFEGYQLNWNWGSKMIFIIRRANRPLRVAEILKYMISIPDPMLTTKRKLLRSLAANTERPVRSKRLYRYKAPGIKPYFYCLPEWVDENGQIKPYYLNKIQTEL